MNPTQKNEAKFSKIEMNPVFILFDVDGISVANVRCMFVELYSV